MTDGKQDYFSELFFCLIQYGNCEGPIFAMKIFLDLTGLNLVDNASQEGMVARISPASTFTGGAMWFSDPQFIDDGFITEFEFRLTDAQGLDSSGQLGGDGMAFVVQNVSDEELGSISGELGYAGIPKSLAVEFDTWWNDWDLSSNDIGIHSRGINANNNREQGQLALDTVPGNFADGRVHHARIEYTPGWLSVFLDGADTPTTQAEIADLADFIGADEGFAWVGFTASTGGAVENHDVLSWFFESRRVIRGDVDGNRVLDVSDINLISEAIRGKSVDPLFDLNSDGIVNEDDRRFWVESLANTYFGDANLDGEFNSGDMIAAFQAGEYEDNVLHNSTWEDGDWNGNGDFGTADLVIAFQDGGFEQGPRVALQNVPEPSTSLLIYISILGLTAFRRYFIDEKL